MSAGSDPLSPGAPRVEPVDPGLEVRFEPGLLPVPPGCEERVDAAWSRALSSGRLLFDGTLLALARFEAPSRLVVSDVPYRVHLARSEDSVLREELEVYPVAVTGVLRVGDAYLLGRRSLRMAHHGGLLELAPSGSLPLDAVRGSEVDWKGQLLRELEEETGLSPSRVDAVRPLALVLDEGIATWDICAELSVTGAEEEVREALDPSSGGEYSELLLEDLVGLGRRLEESPETLIPTTRALIGWMRGR